MQLAPKFLSRCETLGISHWPTLESRVCCPHKTGYMTQSVECGRNKKVVAVHNIATFSQLIYLYTERVGVGRCFVFNSNYLFPNPNVQFQLYMLLCCIDCFCVSRAMLMSLTCLIQAMISSKRTKACTSSWAPHSCLCSLTVCCSHIALPNSLMPTMSSATYYGRQVSCNVYSI